MYKLCATEEKEVKPIQIAEVKELKMSGHFSIEQKKNKKRILLFLSK